MLTKQEILQLKTTRVNILSPCYLYSDKDIDTLLQLELKGEAYILEGLVFEAKEEDQTNNQAIFGASILDAYLNTNALPIVAPVNLVSQHELKEAENKNQSPGNHWISLVIFPQLNEIPPKIVISNPFGNGLGIACDLTYQASQIKIITYKLIELGTFLQRLLHNIGIEIKSSEFLITGTVRQKNSFDCGPHIVQTIIETVRHIPRFQVNSTTETGVRLRKKHAKLITYTLSNNKPTYTLSFCGLTFYVNKQRDSNKKILPETQDSIVSSKLLTIHK